MSPRRTKTIVVDASVARAAGTTEAHASRACREALRGVLRICHRIFMTEDIFREWKIHRSKFSKRWLDEMYSRRKVVRKKPFPIEIHGNAKIGLSENESKALDKDRLLLEAACACDGVVLTCDAELRRILDKCGPCLPIPKPIHWIDPVRDGVAALEAL